MLSSGITGRTPVAGAIWSTIPPDRVEQGGVDGVRHVCSRSRAANARDRSSLQPGRTDRGHRDGVPVPRRAGRSRVLAAAGGGWELGHRRRPGFGCGAGGRTLPGRLARDRSLPLRGLSGGARPLRRPLLPHLAGRGAAPGPAAAPHARSDLAGPRGRGDGPGAAAGQPHRRVRRNQQLRLPRPDPGSARSFGAGGKPVCGHGDLIQHRHRPGRVRAGPHRTGHGARHRLLVVAGRDPPGGFGPAAGRSGSRARRRGSHDPVGPALGVPRARRNARAGRAVQGVRRQRQRVRARRGLRHPRPEAASRSRGRRRPDLGRHPGIGGQPGRGEPGTDRAERGVAGTGHRGRARAGGGPGLGGGLSGSARHRHGSRRPHRNTRRGGGLRQGKRDGPTVADRFGEDQRRAPGTGGRGRRPHQDPARHAAGSDSETPALPNPEPGDGLGPAAAPGHRGTDGVAGPCGSSPAGGGERIRMVGDERARRRSGIRNGPRRRRSPGRAVARRTRASDHRFLPEVGRARTARRRTSRGARGALPAAVREVGGGAPRTGRPLPGLD